jgi:hypothetical protein
MHSMIFQSTSNLFNFWILEPPGFELFPLRDGLDFLMLIIITSGFLPRVRARALCTSVFLGSLTRKTGALRAPAHRSFAASDLAPKTFPQARTRAARDVLYIFPLG